MKRTGNKNLKIAAATMMTIFSLFTCFSGAMAWFMGMRTFDEEMENFEVKSTNGLLESITFHELVARDTTSNPDGSITTSNFYFDTAPSGSITYDWNTKTATPSDNTTISLDQYTPLNPVQPLLLMFNLTEEVFFDATSEFNIKGVSESNDFLGMRTASFKPLYSLNEDDENSAVIKQENDTNYFSMSSVVDFKFVEFSREKENGESDGDLNSPETSLDNVKVVKNNNETYRIAPTDLTQGKNFVSFLDEEVQPFQNTVDIYSNSEDRYVKHIALVIDYYQDAVEYIYFTFLGDTTLETQYSNILHFICDWALEVF